ncbi:hypothetical protein K2173_024261 [Erythroxylum novogranatense]|uniref:NB-ARC domain-containing protein n=1 Tax=Erythroxylum novogranatense TaxID=1862640 RepID=A0AAV8STX4_9ROSI|nr:hypothetical protein K2173_024261 [Erythroxylum novogranatense]
MDALQAVASAVQIVSSMVGTVTALEQACRNLDEAPKRIRSLEEFVCSLENLTRRIRQKHAYKLHNSQLDQQVQSLNVLIERLHPKISRARRIVSRSRVKNLAKVVWNSMAGDPLEKLTSSIRDDLNWWLESQRLVENVDKVIESTALEVPVQLKIRIEQGCPSLNKCHHVRNLLERHDSHQVILIVGLSGIGKSYLARQVASSPPTRFIGGAVELRFGQWCSRNACNGNKDEYQKRLARKISKFLIQIGYWKKFRDENSGDLEYVCLLLQEALYGKSILVLLDDVWEQDIVDRFAKLYDNDCKYLVTTRNEAVCEITEAEKVELSKDDTREISKAILLHHSLLSEEELPGLAETLLERCGHHPLTVAVMGKALRKEVRADKWEKATLNLSTFATCAPGPVSYVNEKEAENTITIFGSLEFSLEAMPEDSKRLFVALALISWVEPVPEACLEAIWLVLGEESLFPLIVSKLVEGSLLMKTDTDPLYMVHDMVSLYLDSKTNDSIEILLVECSAEEAAFIFPWLLIYGKENIKKIAEQRFTALLDTVEENLVVSALEALIQALMASKSMSELETSRARFSCVLGPRILDLISSDSKSLIAVTAEAITNVFDKDDYASYFPSIENADTIHKVAKALGETEDPIVQINMLAVLAKFAEFGCPETIDDVLQSIPFNRIADLLSEDIEELHESMFNILFSLTKAGKSKAVERMLSFKIEKSLVKILENGSEVLQNHAIVTLKAFYEMSRTQANVPVFLGNLDLLPWQVRLRLETFVLSDRTISHSPKPQTFEDLMHKVIDSDSKKVLEAMQDLIPVVEKACDSQNREMILRSPLIKRLSELLQSKFSQENQLRSESAFLLMKLACSGGEPCIKKFLDYSIIPDLVKMMHCQIAELQDSAYTALHQMLFASGGFHVFNKIFQISLIDKMVLSLDSKSIKTQEVNLQCIFDLVELGNKVCLERMLSLQLVEKLVKVEKANGGTGKTVVEFLKEMDRCKHLSTMERRVLKQQVVRKIRASLKGHKFETQVLAAAEGCISEGSKAGSGSGRCRR